MYMNLKPNQHKRISFNTTTMTSLGFIASPPPPPPTPKMLAPPLNLAHQGGSLTHQMLITCILHIQP